MAMQPWSQRRTVTADVRTAYGFSSMPYGFPLSTSADPIGITGDWMG